MFCVSNTGRLEYWSTIGLGQNTMTLQASFWHACNRRTRVSLQIVNLIEETGHFNVTNTTFDFDLFSLDESTVRKLQSYLEATATWQEGRTAAPLTPAPLRPHLPRFFPEKTKWENKTEKRRKEGRTGVSSRSICRSCLAGTMESRRWAATPTTGKNAPTNASTHTHARREASPLGRRRRGWRRILCEGGREGGVE